MAKTKGTEGLISIKTKQDRNFSLFEIKSVIRSFDKKRKAQIFIKREPFLFFQK
jgi:hypothetical protein